MKTETIVIKNFNDYGKNLIEDIAKKFYKKESFYQIMNESISNSTLLDIATEKYANALGEWKRAMDVLALSTGISSVPDVEVNYNVTFAPDESITISLKGEDEAVENAINIFKEHYTGEEDSTTEEKE